MDHPSPRGYFCTGQSVKIIGPPGFNRIIIHNNNDNKHNETRKKERVVITYYIRVPICLKRTLSGGSTNKILFSTCIFRLVVLIPTYLPTSYAYVQITDNVYIISSNGMGLHVYTIMYIYLPHFCTKTSPNPILILYCPATSN